MFSGLLLCTFKKNSFSKKEAVRAMGETTEKERGRERKRKKERHKANRAKEEEKQSSKSSYC